MTNNLENDIHIGFIRSIHDGEIEVGEVVEVFLGLDKVNDIGVVNTHYPHIGSAPESALLNSLGYLTEDPHK